MTLRGLARASALYTVGNFLPRLGAFLLLPIYVRYMSRADFGTVSLITALTGLLATVYRLGLDGALMRFHFEEKGDRQAALYSTLTVASFLAALVGAALASLILGPFFVPLFSGLGFLPYGLLGVATAAAGAVSFAPAVYFRATGQAGRFLLYGTGSFAFGSAASIALVLLGWGASGMLIGQLVGGLAAVAVTLVLVVRIAGTRFDGSLIPPAIRFGAPLVPHAISAWVLRLADRWLIGLLIGLPAVQALQALGAYALGYQLGYVITTLVLSFNAAWSPWFFRMGDDPDAPLIFREMTSLVMAGLAAVAVAASVLAPQIVELVARPEYRPAAGVLPVIAMASVWYGLYTMLSTVIFFAKATGRLALITASAAAVNVFLNLILIPRLGILGAAWATFGAYTFFAVAAWRYSLTIYPVRLDLRRLGLIAAYACVALFLASLTDHAASPLVSGVLRALLAAGFVAVATAFALEPARVILSVVRGRRASASS